MLMPAAAMFPPQNELLAVEDGNRFTIRQATNDGTIMLSFQPAKYQDTSGIGSEPPYARWNMGIAPPVMFGGNSQKADIPWFMGYNLGKGGGGISSVVAAEHSDEPCFGFVFEPHYSFSGNNSQVEAYYTLTPAGADPGTHQVRPFMWTAQFSTLARNTDPTIGLYIDVDETEGFSIEIDHAGGTARLGWHESPVATQDVMCEVTGAAGFGWENNVQCLKQKTSSGTYKNLAYIDSNNYLTLGEGGLLQTRIGAFLYGWPGIGTAYKTSSGTFTDADITGTVQDGAIGITNFSGTRKIWGRCGGAWYGVAIT